MKYVFPACEGFVGVAEASKDEVDSVRVRMVDICVGSFPVVSRREVIIEASLRIVLQDIRESVYRFLGHPLELFCVCSILDGSWQNEMSDRSISVTLAASTFRCL